jgi:hypothetical protein
MDIFKKLCIPKETLNKLNVINDIVQDASLENNAINEMIEKLIPVTCTDDICEIPNVLHDIEMFNSYDDDDTLFDSIMKTNLQGSAKYLKHCIEQPINDVDTLRRRVSTLKDLEKKMQISKVYGNMVEQLHIREDSLPWLFNKRDTEDIRAAYNIVYFNTVVTKPLNRIPKLLTAYNIYKIVASPVIGILSPITYFLIPYLIIIFKLKLKIGFFVYVRSIVSAFLSQKMTMHIVPVMLSALFYFQGVFNSVEISKATYSISKYIVNSMNNVSEFLITAKHLCEEFWDDEIDKVFFGDTHISCEHECFKCKPFNIISNFGEPLRDFKTFEPSEYISLIQRMYKLDAVASICNIKQLSNMSYPTFLKSDKPVLNIKGVFHPYLKSPIKNNFHLDQTRGAIITGPNAGGKSTLIKSILINILLSQTLCIVNSTDTKLTPFKYISSQINVPDRKGKQSLFEAEMLRAKYTLDKLDNVDGFSIIFMDEIFNSTNPVEGISGAYAIAKKMSSYSNNMMIFTTHYIYLTKLASEFPDRFANMKMNIKMNNITERIKFPYKLTSGISRQCIALELLKQNDFDENLISDALCIKARLHSQK